MSHVIPEVTDVHVGRQAIYDRQGDVAAYELLFRNAPGARSATNGGVLATSQVMVAAFTTVGLDELAGGRRCFINLTADLLLGELPVPFAPEHAVLEVLETVHVDDRLVAGVAALVARGYVIAFDDFVSGSGHERLFELATACRLALPAGSRRVRNPPATGPGAAHDPVPREDGPGGGTAAIRSARRRGPPGRRSRSRQPDR
jgi:hypothetical protein